MWEKGGWKDCCTLCVEVCATEGSVYCTLYKDSLHCGRKVCTVHGQEVCGMGGSVHCTLLFSTRNVRMLDKRIYASRCPDGLF